MSRWKVCRSLPAAVLFLRLCATAQQLQLEHVGDLRLPDDAPEGLSAIAWLGDGRVAFAEDSDGRIHTASLKVDPDTGAILSCSFDTPVVHPEIVDAEGAAFNGSDTLFVSDEYGSRIFSLPVSRGRVGDSATLRADLVPLKLRTARGNRSIEALSFSGEEPSGVSLWMATEDALPADEACSAGGALVRLCRVPLNGIDTPQAWFVRLEAPPPAVPLVPGPKPFNGLSGLCALGNGKLLLLERAYGLTRRSTPEGGASDGLITGRIFLVDVAAKPPFNPDEDNPPIVPLRKKLLAEFVEADLNFEGICLGPVLSDGSRALLLVSDGDRTQFPRTKVYFQWGKALRCFRISGGSGKSGGSGGSGGSASH